MGELRKYTIDAHPHWLYDKVALPLAKKLEEEAIFQFTTVIMHKLLNKKGFAVTFNIHGREHEYTLSTIYRFKKREVHPTKPFSNRLCKHFVNKLFKEFKRLQTVYHDPFQQAKPADKVLFNDKAQVSAVESTKTTALKPSLKRSMVNLHKPHLKTIATKALFFFLGFAANIILDVALDLYLALALWQIVLIALGIAALTAAIYLGSHYMYASFFNRGADLASPENSTVSIEEAPYVSLP